MTTDQHVDAILDVRVDSFHQVLEGLDPISRALIELSVIQNLDDGEIASMLGNDEELVRAQREDVVRQVAGRIDPASDGAEISALEAIVAGAVERETPTEVEPQPDPEPDPLAAFIVPTEQEEPLDDRPTGVHEVVHPEWLDEPEYQPKQREPEQSSRRRTLTIVIGLAAVLAVIVAVQRAGDSGSDKTPTPTKAAAPAPQPTAPKAAKLAAVGKTGATGTASVANGRLTMNVKGLPEGTYTVWLYNSVIDSKPLKTVKGTSINVDAKLPADAKNYKFIDVSQQPAGSTANHSGESVLRVATP